MDVSWTIHEESWALKNWCFKTVVLERPNQSILKEISPECSLEGLILKLKLQYFGHLMWRTHWKRPWCWERLKAGGEGDGRGWDDWMASPTQWTWVWVSSGSWWWIGKPGALQSMRSQRVGHTWATELNWKIHASGFNELLESIFCILLVVEAFSLQKVVEMFEEVVVGWREVRWTWRMRQNFVAQSICSTFEALVVQHVARRCHGEGLGSFHWPMLAAGMQLSVHLIDLPFTSQM